MWQPFQGMEKKDDTSNKRGKHMHIAKFNIYTFIYVYMYVHL